MGLCGHGPRVREALKSAPQSAVNVEFRCEEEILVFKVGDIFLAYS